ncbi:unnamed protein product, partial [Rotaria sp. Silwood1]
LDINIGRKLLSRYEIYLTLALIELTSHEPPETMTNHTTQVIECLNKLYDLIPDGIITYECRERHTMTGSSSNEQSIDFGFNLMMLSQDDGNVQNPSSSIAGLTTALSSTSTNKFLVFHTYKTCRH